MSAPAAATTDRKCNVCSGWESDHATPHAFVPRSNQPFQERGPRERWGSNGVGLQIKVNAATTKTFDQATLEADVLEFSGAHNWYKHLMDGPVPFYPVPRFNQAKRHPIDPPNEKDNKLHWQFCTPTQMRLHADVLGDVIAEAALSHPVYCTVKFSPGNPAERAACVAAANAAWTHIHYRSQH